MEEASAQRVAESGFFQGVKTEDIFKLAEEMISTGELHLRKGWLDLFEMFLPSSSPPAGSKISILSVNWSEAWIRGSLLQAAKTASPRGQAELLEFIQNMEISSNRIEGLDLPQGSNGRMTGGVHGPIRTSADKLLYLPPSRSTTDGKRTDPATSEDSPLVVYVGDSSTDFDCLRCADVGIWIADVPETQYQAKFAEVFRPLKYVPPSLETIDENALCAWAPDLQEIAEVVGHRKISDL